MDPMRTIHSNGFTLWVSSNHIFPLFIRKLESLELCCINISNVTTWLISRQNSFISVESVKQNLLPQVIISPIPSVVDSISPSWLVHEEIDEIIGDEIANKASDNPSNSQHNLIIDKETYEIVELCANIHRDHFCHSSWMSIINIVSKHAAPIMAHHDHLSLGVIYVINCGLDTVSKLFKSKAFFGGFLLTEVGVRNSEDISFFFQIRKDVFPDGVGVRVAVEEDKEFGGVFVSTDVVRKDFGHFFKVKLRDF